MVIEKFLSVVKAHSRQSFHSIALAKKSKKKYYIKTFLFTRAIDQDIRPYNGHLIDLKLAGKFEFHKSGFHLHLLVFPFVYQFNSRIGVLVNSSFEND